MNEQQILEHLLKDPRYIDALRSLIIHDSDLAKKINSLEQKNMYIWCAEVIDATTNINYYHPIIIPNKNMSMDFDSLMNINNYVMMCATNQFDAYAEYEQMVNMFVSVYGVDRPIRLISVPENVFAKLNAALHSLVSATLDELNMCFSHIDTVAKITNTDSTMLKIGLIGSVFGKMTTVSYCFDQSMNVVDSVNHDYSSRTYCDFEEDDDYDEENYFGC